MIDIIKSKKQSIGKIQLISFNPKTDNKYFKYPRLIVNGERKRIVNARFNMPSEELRKWYDSIKKEDLKPIVTGMA